MKSLERNEAQIKESGKRPIIGRDKEIRGKLTPPYIRNKREKQLKTDERTDERGKKDSQNAMKAKMI